MKNALIFGQTLAGVTAPCETNPTVLGLVAVTSDLPIRETANTALTALSAVSDGALGTLPLMLIMVRVEDAVVIGDTLDKSGDVYHKHVEG